MNKYGLALIDGSFIINRNIGATVRGKDISEYSVSEVLRLTIQTLNKMARDYGITADKLCLIFDEWLPDFDGYYRTWLLKDYGQYKGSRPRPTEQSLEALRTSGATQKRIEEEEKALALHNLRREAKRAMKEEFGKIGIPYFSFPGYEFDDIATTAAFSMTGKRNKPDVIITKDSDLQYSLVPGEVEYFSLPTYGSSPKIITYDDVYANMPEGLKQKNLSLYMYHAYVDSLGGGHNDNIRVMKAGKKYNDVVSQLLDGDTSSVENLEVFKAQLGSFNVPSFPRYDEVLELIRSFYTAGHIGSGAEFMEFCNRTGVKGITESYYNTFAARLDQKLYSE